MTKAVITGVAGFVGSTLAETILRDGIYDEVVGIDSYTDYYSRSLKEANLNRLDSARFKMVVGDINKVDLEDLLTDAQHVYHLAGQPGVRSSWGEQFQIYTNDNVNATQRLLEACRSIDTLERFVYSSSSSVYGDASAYPTTEEMLPRPRSPYGVSKLAAEHLCNVYAWNFGVPTVSLRYFTVYGPRQRPDMAFTRFFSATRDGKELRIYGDGEQIRDFTYVDDVVAANITSAQISVEPGTVFNVSGGSSVSVNEVIAEIESITGKTPLVRYERAVSGDVRRTGGSSRLASERIGWSPRISLKEGLTRQWNWINRP